MIPEFQADGNLPKGVHCATWEELVTRFGTTAWRKELLGGLRRVLESLRDAGCRTVYVDGSLVTERETPGDFDVCWDPTGVDPTLLDPVLGIFDPGRATQKAKFLGESFPSNAPANPEGDTFLELFQRDKDTDKPKGIIALNLEELT